MADLFRCDHCGGVFRPDEKMGQVTLTRNDWRGGVKFPSVKVHEHDLCKECFGKLAGAISEVIRRQLRS